MKNKMITYLFIGYISLFSIMGILFKDETISKSERRTLASFPQFTFTNEYSEKLEQYSLDHFPFRDDFRSIKANWNYNVFHKLDNNGISLKDSYIFQSEYPTNQSSIHNFINVINDTKQHFSKHNNIYMMIIPDKRYYIDDEDFLSLDYSYLYEEVKKTKIKQIDIRSVLELQDYYETDTHWKQENLEKVVQTMGKEMDFDYQEEEYEKIIYPDFYGVYFGLSGIDRKAENLTYMINDPIQNARVVYLENAHLTTVYNTEKLTGLDSYEVYLDGASAFIEIYSDHSITDRELVIFRDSFAGSLTPLLIPYYKKITLIDTRYIDSDHYLKLITFDDQDILFMYSTLLVNNSVTLKR